MCSSLRQVLSVVCLSVFTVSLPAADDGWIDLSSTAKAREAWTGLSNDWIITDRVELDEKNPRLLSAKPEAGAILVNGAKGRLPDLVTKEKYADLEVQFEFLVGKGSNSGVKLMGLYEIQIHDSHGVKELTGSHCGGIYPRAEDKPNYRTIDKGVPPKVNAAKPAGEWQTLHLIFKAPRFDKDGKKTANARFVKVVLNGQVIHENVDVEHPTGSAWRLKKEIASGPLLLQADHGPVAFRSVRIRPLADK